MVPLHAWVMWQDSKKEFVEIFVPVLFVYQHFFLPWASLPFLCNSYVSSWEIHEPAKLKYTSEDKFLGKRCSYDLPRNLWGSFGADDEPLEEPQIFPILCLLEVPEWEKKWKSASLTGIFSLWILSRYWWCWNESWKSLRHVWKAALSAFKLALMLMDFQRIEFVSVCLHEYSDTRVL